ncbi:MAG: hypothetical protein WBE25_07525, partial [Xanthobacteraceae bacterium]
VVERRQASAPEAEGRRKPPSPWRALCAACVQVVNYASAGVPLPYFFVAWVERPAFARSANFGGYQSAEAQSA